MFRTKVVEKIETHTLCSVTFCFLSKKSSVYEIMWKNIVRARQAADDNMTHMLFMLGN